MSQDGEQHISLRTYVYNEELPLPIVIRKPIKPRPIDSDESGEELEDIYPAPICISCSGVDNDPLVWCSGCADPYHTDVSCTRNITKILNRVNFSIFISLNCHFRETITKIRVNSELFVIFSLKWQMRLKMRIF